MNKRVFQTILCILFLTLVCAEGNFVNIAFAKETMQSSTFGNMDIYAASKAVDNDTTTFSHTRNNSKEWWEVDLGGVYPVLFIQIFPFYQKFQRIASALISVDGQECARISEIENNSTNIKCSRLLYGRRINIKKFDDASDKYLQIVEFVVWACLEGFHGEQCNLNCGHCYEGTACDRVTGYCPRCKAGFVKPMCTDKCVEGMYGEDCSIACGQCAEGETCHHVNGSCQNCVEGKKLPNCTTECDDGYYGRNCARMCGQCQGGEFCNKSSGHCSSCSRGKQPPLCKLNCTQGTFGSDCLQKCGSCENMASCDIVSGHCPTCQAGFQPPLCVEKCQNGSYGYNCGQTCGHCKDGETCNATNGKCVNGCAPGWLTENCNRVCENGTYGENCTKECGKCGDSSTCNAENGECRSCLPGFRTPFCREVIDSKVVVEEKGDNIGAIVGPIVAVVVVLTIISIVIIVVLKRRKSVQSNEHANESRDTNAQHNDNTTINSEVHDPILKLSTSAIDSAKPKAAVKPQVKGQAFSPSRGNEAIYENVVTTVEVVRCKNSNDQRNDANGGRQNHVEGKINQSLPPSNGESQGPMGSKTVMKREYSETDTERDDDEVSDIEDDNNVYANDATSFLYNPAAVPTSALKKYLLEQIKAHTFDVEFSNLPTKMLHNQENGQKKENYYKNRFNSILPYDSTRVVLERANDNDSDYINASYIQGYKGKTYIAAQGPKNNTLTDFWRMVWQERVRYIVMLTNVLENTKAKCHEYWPIEGATQMYDPIEVKSLNEQHRAHYVIRTFEIKNVYSQETRCVEQFHYVSWFDHDVPRTIDLVDFWRFVRSRAYSRTASPLLVHCSAGVGRTGTYLALDIVMDHAQHEKEVNIYAIVKRMREERCCMVQNKKQYEFLHEVVLEAYASDNTRLSVTDFDKDFPLPLTGNTANRRIDQEYETLKQMTVAFTTSTYNVSMQDENQAKNRNPNVLPEDKHLVYLTPYASGRNQYINAVFMSTFIDPRGCILTQLPLPETIVDIWRLIDGCGVKIVVSIGNNNDKEEESCRYWPIEEGATIRTGIYAVTLTSKAYMSSNLVSYKVNLKNQDQEREMCIWSYTEWVKECPTNTADLLHIIELLQAHTQTKGYNPVVVQCKDGASKSGLLCALWEIICRMSHTNEVDIYLAVRKVQSVRPQSINSLVQYRYCYEVAQQYKNSTSVYTNIKYKD